MRDLSSIFVPNIAQDSKPRIEKSEHTRKETYLKTWELPKTSYQIPRWPLGTKC